MPHSAFIARFLAKQFQLVGKDNLEQIEAEAVVDTIKNALTVFMPVYGEKDETKKQEMMKKSSDEDLLFYAVPENFLC